MSATLSFPPPRSARPPLLGRHLEAGLFTWGRTDETALELEVRGVLAALYSEEHAVALRRYELAADYLGHSKRSQEMLLGRFDAQNAVELGVSL